MKNSGILLCRKRMPSGRGDDGARKASGGQKEKLRSHYPTRPVKTPAHVPEGRLRHAPLAPDEHVRPLPCSTPSPLSAAHLSSMLQDSIDQCLQNAPEKNA